MSEQTKFKVGDRVRAKNPNWELHFDCGNDFGILTHTDVGIVKGQSHLGDDFIEVAFCDGWVCEDFTEDELELVESYDPKTAFLTELKELLIKHNADIWVDSIGFDDNFLRIDINGAEKQSFKVGNSLILHDEEIKIEPLEPNWY